MSKHQFGKIEFYITNVCNLNCKDCNRFNNHNFKGWQRWSDYESVYQQWSNHIGIKQIVLLGGEPLLNPDILDWIYGLNRVFNRPVQILSNGTHINKVSGLYQALRKNGNWLGISWHNPNTLDEFEHEISQFLQGPIVKLPLDHPDNHCKDANTVWMDANKVKIPLWIQYDFYKSAIQPTINGRLTLHNSDPLLAHENCGFVKSKNYHFIKGKLYKCGPVALFPEFDQQHQLEISDQDRALINSYEPLTVEGLVQHGPGYFDQLDQPLAQCKFCPDAMKFTQRTFAISKNLARKQINLQ